MFIKRFYPIIVDNLFEYYRVYYKYNLLLMVIFLFMMIFQIYPNAFGPLDVGIAFGGEDVVEQTLDVGKLNYFFPNIHI